MMNARIDQMLRPKPLEGLGRFDAVLRPWPIHRGHYDLRKSTQLKALIPVRCALVDGLVVGRHTAEV